jgi:uncharacterized protein (TIGR00369 family)
VTPPPAHADRFAPLEPSRRNQWASFPRWQGRTLFPNVVGIEVEELRTDYARLRVPWRDELAQVAGLMHGGVLATMIDTVVVPAIGTHYDLPPRLATITLNVNFVAAVIGEDAVAEGWVVRRGRSVVFCEAEVRSDRGALAATGSVVYKVDPAASPAS